MTLIEVLIAIIIIAVGLLGLAALQNKAQQAEFESYQRTQALVLVEDMANRIQANRVFKNCYILADANIDYVGSGYTFSGTGCNASADTDLTEWDALLDGAAEKTSTDTNIGAMLNARGCITYNATGNFFTVSVVWQGLSATKAHTGNTCGQGLVTNDAQRRVVSVNFMIGDLIN